jgi:uncharacterized Zn-binding protein involved in type VI secretion
MPLPVPAGICKIGDLSDHGGHLIYTSQTFVRCNHQLVCVKPTTLHSCPIPGHGVTPIVYVPGHNCWIEGKTIVTIGSKAGCGATMITACLNTTVK